MLNYNENFGPVPFFVYPDSSLKQNKERMKLLNVHYIWQISLKEQSLLDYIDLGYKDKFFFARKFITVSKKQIHEKGPEYDNFETIVIILALPEDLSMFGGELLIKLTSEIISNFEGLLYKVIKSESYKEEIIKTSKIKEIIKQGDNIKNNLKLMIDTTCVDFFSSILKKENPSSLKQQKAISFFTLKGITEEKLGVLAIQEIRTTNNQSEIEIKAVNNTKSDLINTSIKITHLQDFLEKEIMNERIDIWYPNEELMLGFPILPKVDEYLITIKKEDDTWLSRKINLKLL